MPAVRADRYFPQPEPDTIPTYAARNATKSKGTSSLKLDSDPLGSPEQARALTDLSSAKSPQRVFGLWFLGD
jgi:hypothetical protein